MRGSRGYFVDEIMVVNIRDFDISFLIDLGDYTCSLAWYDIVYVIGIL